MNAVSKAFELVFYSELFFFEGCDRDFIPVGVGHFVVDAFFESLMFFGQFLDMPLQCHACTSS